MKDFSYNPFLFEFRRKSSSTTQGSVEVYYDGVYLETFGDNIELKDGRWQGLPDSAFMPASKRILKQKLYKFIDSIDDN